MISCCALLLIYTCRNYSMSDERILYAIFLIDGHCRPENVFFFLTHYMTRPHSLTSEQQSNFASTKCIEMSVQMLIDIDNFPLARYCFLRSGMVRNHRRWKYWLFKKITLTASTFDIQWQIIYFSINTLLSDCSQFDWSQIRIFISQDTGRLMTTNKRSYE